MGVFHALHVRVLAGRGLPHARGGVSVRTLRALSSSSSSPRPWGCFLPCRPPLARSRVFPTPVGVFPQRDRRHDSAGSLPHARGGVSHFGYGPAYAPLSSPRPWGCFRSCPLNGEDGFVFPTPVGVFQRRERVGELPHSLPHARGGESYRFKPQKKAVPRKRGAAFVLGRIVAFPGDGGAGEGVGVSALPYPPKESALGRGGGPGEGNTSRASRGVPLPPKKSPIKGRPSQERGGLLCWGGLSYFRGTAARGRALAFPRRVILLNIAVGGAGGGLGEASLFAAHEVGVPSPSALTVGP